TFKDGLTTIGTGTLAGGSATFSTATLSVGGHSITAEYSNDGNFNASTSALLTQTVNKADTTTTLSSSANPSVYGQSVTFTATVTATAPGAGTPTGTATFKDGLTTIGTGTLRSEEHTSELQSLAYLVCCLLLENSNDGNFNASTSALLTQTVNKAD